jgi:ferredoxin
MTVRKIINIDEDLCNGCGNCIPNCPEGALQVIDGKARLVSDLFCDGLGACIGECPIGAISVTEREAEKYDETKVMENIVKQGQNVVAAHLKHLKDHNENALYNEAIGYLNKNNLELLEQFSGQKSGTVVSDDKDKLPCGCPGSAVMDIRDAGDQKVEEPLRKHTERNSCLKQWPVQIMLVPPSAPYLQNSDLLIAADCVPFAYPSFHEDFLDKKIVLVGCPKLDDQQYYTEKFTEIFRTNDIKSLTVVHMEVPCCFGMLSIIKQAIKNAGKSIRGKSVNIGIRGNIISEEIF